MQLLLTVNGMVHEVEARPTARLLDVLRDQLGLTGTKEGCAEGECGACTVIVDGKAVNSCVMLAVQARGKEVLTVEGLAPDGELDLLQQKFVEYGAVQCGYCTPGMLMSAKALLMGNPVPSEQDIRIALAGNLCRCTGYSAIVAAVKAASGQEAVPLMELPGDAEELAAEVVTDPETLAAACEVVLADADGPLGAPCDSAGPATGPAGREVSDVAATKVLPPRVWKSWWRRWRRPRRRPGCWPAAPTWCALSAGPKASRTCSSIYRDHRARLHPPRRRVAPRRRPRHVHAAAVGPAGPRARAVSQPRSGAGRLDADPQRRHHRRQHRQRVALRRRGDGAHRAGRRRDHGRWRRDDEHTSHRRRAARPEPYGPAARRGDHRVLLPGARGRSPLGVRQDRLTDGGERRPAERGAVVRFDAAAQALTDVRVALGAVGETAFRAPSLEQSLLGRAADEETARLFAQGCVLAVQESIPGRYSLPYKQHAALGLAYDAWNMLALSAPCEPAWS